MEEETVKTNYGSLGKYMYFSDDKDVLIRLAVKFLIEYQLYSAKVPRTIIPKPSFLKIPRISQ
jgi:hypothetical protein